MIQLTGRLQTIAGEIKQNETMADVGTDHGFLPIYLWEQGISPTVILTDVSPGSLAKAEQCARENHPAEPFDFRLGSGIQVLRKGEVDVVVIAGMGGLLIKEILKDDLDKTKAFRKLILQPRSGQGRLRYWLIRHGFGIMKESLAEEGKFICEVLTVEPLGRQRPVSRELAGCGERSVQYEAPPWIKSAGPLAVPFLERKLAAERSVQDHLSESRNGQQEKLRSREERIAYLEGLLGGV